MSDADSLSAALQKVAQLEFALEARDHIGVAKGMLMLRYGLTNEQAFAYMARRSQEENVKIRDLALSAAADLSAIPWAAEPNSDGAGERFPTT